MNKIRKELHGSKFSYDINSYNFKAILEDLYGCELDKLHNYLGAYEVFKRSNDQGTLAHKVFYSNFEKNFQLKYIKLMHDVIKPLIGEEFYYQKIPTFRIGLPGNKFVGEYHKDTNYNHKGYEVNFNLGLCGYVGEAALKTQKSENSEEYITLECPYGTIFSFDHIDCLHGSDENPYDTTMVSIDFRLAIKSLYFEDNSSSVNMNMKFVPGQYFTSEAI